MNEIARAKANLLVHTTQPLNAEPALDVLVANFVTPQDKLYIRTHGEVQHLDADIHKVKVTGRVEREMELGLTDLKARFSRRTELVVLQCAGNRRADLQQVAKTEGDAWRAGAIGNVAWTGVLLSDVLAAAGVPADSPLQVAFYTCDEIEVDGEKGRFGVSIPVAKAMRDPVLLAFEADGEPLTPEHGYPVRVIVPGYAGVRSAKWLSEIRVQEEVADSLIQRHDYKLFPASATKDGANWEAAITIDAMPINSAICAPPQGATLEAGPVRLKGWATASERRIKRVDVSIDGGSTWVQADLRQDDQAPCAWTLWDLETRLEKGPHELVVRAWDEALQTQPASPHATWNFPGYLATHQHRIHVSVD